MSSTYIIVHTTVFLKMKRVEDITKLIIKILEKCAFRWFNLYNHKIK